MKKYLASAIMFSGALLAINTSSFAQEPAAPKAETKAAAPAPKAETKAAAPAPKAETKAAAPAPKAEQKSDVKIANGKMASIEYLLKVDDKVVDSNVGKPPLTYIQGNGQIIPGLEKQLEGLKTGDAKKVEVAAKDGYGEYSPANTRELKVGTELVLLDTAGRMVPVVIKEIKKDSVVIDMNHPLAGKTLHFDIKVLDVKDAPAEAAPSPKK